MLHGRRYNNFTAMNLEDKEQMCHPQHVVMNTLRLKIVQFGEELNDLADRLDGLEKSRETRSGELSGRIDETERQIEGLKECIEGLRTKIESIEGKYTEMNDFLKETKITWGVWKKCLLFMKEFPGHVVAFVGAVMAIVMYLAKFLGF